jgi:hypothetical protein
MRASRHLDRLPPRQRCSTADHELGGTDGGSLRVASWTVTTRRRAVVLAILASVAVMIVSMQFVHNQWTA